MTVELRDATVDDLSGIMEIYNDAVVNTTAIWNEVVVDLDNRKDWFVARKSRGFPVIVAVLDGKVAGYASYGDWRAFDGYRHTREHSVYVHKDARGHGIGKTDAGAHRSCRRQRRARTDRRHRVGKHRFHPPA